MLERSNYPDDWNSHWRRCDFHNHNYHASQWCHYCQQDDEQDEQHELVAVELTAKFILFVTLYNGGEECEMTKVKSAIEAFDFVKLQSEFYIVKEWGHIFEIDNRLWIYITEEQADMCEVPEPSWWQQSTDLDHVLGVSND